MVSYKELGLVNTKEMFAKAVKGGYAIPALWTKVASYGLPARRIRDL